MELSFVSIAAPTIQGRFVAVPGSCKVAAAYAPSKASAPARRFFGHSEGLLPLIATSSARSRTIAFECVRASVNGVGSPNPPPKSNSTPVKQPKNAEELEAVTLELQDLLSNVSVYLVGMMGCGKSTVGKALASKLHYKFLDTDSIIEQFAKKPVSAIFEEDGEPAFRDLESEVLRNVAPLLKCVISTGGGVVIRRKNWSYLQTGIVIWLDAPAEVLHRRLSDPAASAARPLLSGEPDALMDKLTKLIEDRKQWYSQADVVVDASTNDVNLVISRTIAALHHRLKTDDKYMNRQQPFEQE